MSAGIEFYPILADMLEVGNSLRANLAGDKTTAKVILDSEQFMLKLPVAGLCRCQITMEFRAVGYVELKRDYNV